MGKFITVLGLLFAGQAAVAGTSFDVIRTADSPASAQQELTVPVYNQVCETQSVWVYGPHPSCGWTTECHWDPRHGQVCYQYMRSCYHYEIQTVCTDEFDYDAHIKFLINMDPSAVLLDGEKETLHFTVNGKYSTKYLSMEAQGSRFKYHNVPSEIETSRGNDTLVALQLAVKDVRVETPANLVTIKEAKFIDENTFKVVFTDPLLTAAQKGQIQDIRYHFVLKKKALIAITKFLNLDISYSDLQVEGTQATLLLNRNDRGWERDLPNKRGMQYRLEYSVERIAPVIFKTKFSAVQKHPVIF